MDKLVLVFIIAASFISCRDKDIPDVSDIHVDVQVQRFERDFFSIDTNEMEGSFEKLVEKYPSFFPDFIANILGLASGDSSFDATAAVVKFLSDYRPIYDSSEKIFSNFSKYEMEIEQGLKFVKYYFPSYKIPGKLFTFIGPINSFANVITADALAVGLQLHLGANFFLYQSEIGQSLYPAYISRRFSPEYIPVNCMKNIIDDIFPDKSAGKTLLEQMVEKGRRIYVLDKLMPHAPDTLKTGYTKNQLQGCYKNEGLIWNFFLTNSLLFNNEPAIIKGYIGDAPNTPEFGQGSPGNIGMFIGWQIVKKYMEQNGATSLTQLMQTDNQKIFEESKYRPK